MNFTCLKFVIYGNNPSAGYSGGRYHSWLMANALASAGHSVTYLTSNIPSFIDDFRYMSAKNNLKIKIFKFLNLEYIISEIKDVDWFIVIPDHQSGWQFYSNAYLLSQHTNSKLCLLNFETPNWVNKISKIQRNPTIGTIGMKSQNTPQLFYQVQRNQIFMQKNFTATLKDSGLNIVTHQLIAK